MNYCTREITSEMYGSDDHMVARARWSAYWVIILISRTTLLVIVSSVLYMCKPSRLALVKYRLLIYIVKTVNQRSIVTCILQICSTTLTEECKFMHTVHKLQSVECWKPLHDKVTFCHIGGAAEMSRIAKTTLVYLCQNAPMTSFAKIDQ